MTPNQIFRPAAAIFDMDGLMLDTERPMLNAWIIAGQKMKWPVTKEIALKSIGLVGEDIRKLCLNELGSNFPYDEFDILLHKLFDEEFAKGIGLKPGLTELLDHLEKLHMPIAVATSTNRNFAVTKLKIAGIANRFEIMACGDEVANGKPAPDIFLLAAKRLKQNPGQCIGFEDSAAGLRGLHAAGIKSVFVKDLIEPPDEVLKTVWRRYVDLSEAKELFVPI